MTGFHEPAFAVSFHKLALIGCPGAQCGRRLLESGETVEQADFKDEFGACDNDARWLVGMLFVCQEHAARIAELGGDNIEEIESAWKAML